MNRVAVITLSGTMLDKAYLPGMLKKPTSFTTTCSGSSRTAKPIRLESTSLEANLIGRFK